MAKKHDQTTQDENTVASHAAIVDAAGKLPRAADSMLSTIRALRESYAEAIDSLETEQAAHEKEVTNLRHRYETDTAALKATIARLEETVRKIQVTING